MKLYEIEDTIEQAIREATDPDTGEITDEGLYDRLIILTEQRNYIAINTALAIKNREAESEAIDREIKVLKERKGILDRQADSIKRYLAKFVPEGEKIQDGRAVISWRKSSQVEQADGADILGLPDYLKRVKVEPDKTAIKDAIKSGQDVPGFAIVEKNNIQIK